MKPPAQTHRPATGRRPPAGRAPAVLACCIGLLALGAARTVAAGRAYFAQDRMALAAQPQTLSLLGQDLAAFQSIVLTLRYDEEHLVVTAADLGALVKAVRPESGLTVAAAEPGMLSLRADLAALADKDGAEAGQEGSDEGGAEGAATVAADASLAPTAPELPLPQGSGELFSLTLAPLLKSDQPLAFAVAELKLLGPAGEESLEVAELAVTVDQDPDAAARQAYLDQAAALKPAGPLAGLLGGDWLPGLPTALSPELAWLAVACGGAALAAVAWLLGRRPPPAQDDGF